MPDSKPQQELAVNGSEDENRDEESAESELRGNTNIDWTGDREEFIAEFLARKSKEDILAFLRLNSDIKKVKLSQDASPTIPDEVIPKLPVLMRHVAACFSDPRERDIVLISMLGLFSGCFDNVSGLYRGRRVHSNLFLLISAPPASGKGSMVYARQLVEPWHKRIQQSNGNPFQNVEEETNQAEESELPYLLLIPADTSSAMFLALLAKNGGCGIVCETEAATLTKTLKQGWANHTNLFLMAFHHEPFASGRITAKQMYIEVPRPRVSMLLTAVPGQVNELMPSVNDGMYSRVLHYGFSEETELKEYNSEAGEADLEGKFTELGEQVANQLQALGNQPIKFALTPEQEKLLNDQQRSLWEDCMIRFGPSATSIVKRLGLMTFRIAMVLSAIHRLPFGSYREGKLTCVDSEFEAALELAKIFYAHAMETYDGLPNKRNSGRKTDRRRLLEFLPSGREFTRDEAVAIGGGIPVSERTVGNYLARLVNEGLLMQPRYGHYQKT
ncbi:DUF3987 domain-containing protein [Larkinella sp. C7]|jgi:hypothetical protein|uniref:DUF3987 domain-containing protein n=1 Tax=Larkinella sp. C7 TaxID=2576607 RepID=UPI0011115227|nr:DUF3987 domain-containing protein [Larkinella sp. C7]